MAWAKAIVTTVESQYEELLQLNLNITDDIAGHLKKGILLCL